MLEDALSLLESNEKPFQDEKDNNNKKSTLWNKNDFQPEKIDVNKMDRKEKSYTIAYAHDHKSLTDEQTEFLLKLSVALNNKGYTFRTMCGSQDLLQNNIVKSEGLKSKIFLPWKSFNQDIKKPYMCYPEEAAFNKACAYHKVYNSLPPTIRSILATTVTMLLDKSYTNPASFLICYSECGSETIKKGVDFKKLGNLGFIFGVCKDANIPVFNINNKESVNRLMEKIKE